MRSAVARAAVLAFAAVCAYAGEASAARPARVAVQPIEGEEGPALRAFVARLIRDKGYRVVTSVPAVTGTGQYPELARSHRLAAFVTAELETQRRRARVTFVVWHGLVGDVAGRWTVAQATKKLRREIARGFWKRLGRALEAAPLPPDDRLPPAPPMRIDASSPYDRPEESRSLVRGR
jgi:hypothetical protein